MKVIESRLSKLESRVTKVEIAKTTLKDKEKDKDKDKDVKSWISDAIYKPTQELRAVERRLDELDNKKTGLVKDCVTKINNCDTKISNCDTKISICDKKVKEIENSNKSTDNKIKELEKFDSKAFERKIKDIDAKVTQLKDSESRTTSIDTLRGHLDQLQGTVDTMSTAILSVRNRLNQLQSEITSLPQPKEASQHVQYLPPRPPAPLNSYNMINGMGKGSGRGNLSTIGNKRLREQDDSFPSQLSALTDESGYDHMLHEVPHRASLSPAYSTETILSGSTMTGSNKTQQKQQQLANVFHQQQSQMHYEQAVHDGQLTSQTQQDKRTFSNRECEVQKQRQLSSSSSNSSTSVTTTASSSSSLSKSINAAQQESKPGSKFSPESLALRNRFKMGELTEDEYKKEKRLRAMDKEDEN